MIKDPKVPKMNDKQFVRHCRKRSGYIPKDDNDRLFLTLEFRELILRAVDRLEKKTRN